jgi:hypothetical protein
VIAALLPERALSHIWAGRCQHRARHRHPWCNSATRQLCRDTGPPDGRTSGQRAAELVLPMVAASLEPTSLHCLLGSALPWSSCCAYVMHLCSCNGYSNHTNSRLEYVTCSSTPHVLYLEPCCAVHARDRLAQHSTAHWQHSTAQRWPCCLHLADTRLPMHHTSAHMREHRNQGCACLWPWYRCTSEHCTRPRQRWQVLRQSWCDTSVWLPGASSQRAHR